MHARKKRRNVKENSREFSSPAFWAGKKVFDKGDPNLRIHPNPRREPEYFKFYSDIVRVIRMRFGLFGSVTYVKF